MALFRAENIPMECLEDYIADLKANPGNANGVAIGFLATFSKALQSDQCDNESISERISDYNIFIVHGHDGEAKHKVARFKQPSKGQTIIDKFEEHADEAAFAIVLLTADDVGAPKNNEDDLKSRARQNVILELGYFLHGLGRERVCVLHEEGVELPSDIQGIVYVPFDKAGGWKGTLSRELAALDIIPSTLFLFNQNLNL
ncbi:nucleotide-binding protein [Candidatus Poribacteria bacterium]|nr:nucleotide-binding protein [Candidatus Poribacteria bacterium]